LEKGIHDFVDVLINAYQIVLYQMALSKLNPFFALILLALKLVDKVDVMVRLDWCWVIFFLFYRRASAHRLIDAFRQKVLH